MEWLALLLLAPLLQSGFESSTAQEREKSTPIEAHLASVPTMREEAGRLHIEPPSNRLLTMRVVKIQPAPLRRGPASDAVQDNYVVIVSAP